MNFLDEIFWAKINILPLKIDKKVSKKDFVACGATKHFFFYKSAQFLSDCYEEITFFGNFHRQNKNKKFILSLKKCPFGHFCKKKK